MILTVVSCLAPNCVFSSLSLFLVFASFSTPLRFWFTQLFSLTSGRFSTTRFKSATRFIPPWRTNSNGQRGKGVRCRALWWQRRQRHFLCVLPRNDSQIGGPVLSDVRILRTSTSTSGRMVTNLSESRITVTPAGEEQHFIFPEQPRRKSGSMTSIQITIRSQTDPSMHNNLSKRGRDSEAPGPPAKRPHAQDKLKYAKLFLSTENLPRQTFPKLVEQLQENPYYHTAINAYPSADKTGCILVFPDSISARKYLEAGYTNELSACIIRPTRQPSRLAEFHIYGVLRCY